LQSKKFNKNFQIRKLCFISKRYTEKYVIQAWGDVSFLQYLAGWGKYDHKYPVIVQLENWGDPKTVHFNSKLHAFILIKLKEIVKKLKVLSLIKIYKLPHIKFL